MTSRVQRFPKASSNTDRQIVIDTCSCQYGPQLYHVEAIKDNINFVTQRVLSVQYKWPNQKRCGEDSLMMTVDFLNFKHKRIIFR